MTGTVLIPLAANEVAPRFDLAQAVLLAVLPEEGSDERVGQTTILVLEQPSADALCDLALTRGVACVVCNGIEEEYYHYLRWKRVEVLDAVMGPVDAVLARLAAGRLKSGDILYETGEAGRV